MKNHTTPTRPPRPGPDLSAVDPELRHLLLLPGELDPAEAAALAGGDPAAARRSAAAARDDVRLRMLLGGQGRADEPAVRADVRALRRAMLTRPAEVPAAAGGRPDRAVRVSRSVIAVAAAAAALAAAAVWWARYEQVIDTSPLAWEGGRDADSSDGRESGWRDDGDGQHVTPTVRRARSAFDIGDDLALADPWGPVEDDLDELLALAQPAGDVPQ